MDNYEKYGAGSIIERHGKKGISYLARVRKNGEDEAKTFKDKKSAKKFIDEKSIEIDNGIKQEKKEFGKYTIAKIYEEYLEHNPDDKRNYRLRKMLKTFEKITLEKFTSVQFEKLLKVFLEMPVPMQARAKETNQHKLYKANMVKDDDGNLVRRKYSESTVRKYYYDAKIVLEWHSRLHQYPFNPEPFKNTKTPQAWANQKDKIVEPDELEKILKGWETLRDNIEKGKKLTIFLAKTGFRLGETLLIKKADVKLNLDSPAESYIFIPKKNQKGGRTRKKIKDRYCPLREEIYYLLKDELLPNLNDDDLLFPEWKDGHAFYQRFKNACMNVGLEHISPHLLRHTAIAYYFSDTLLTDIEIMNITSHLDAKTLLGYTKLRPQQTGKKLWKGLN